MPKWQHHGFICSYICRRFQYPSRILNAKGVLKNFILYQLLVVLIYTHFNVLFRCIRRIILPPESSIFLYCMLPDVFCLRLNTLSLLLAYFLLIFELMSSAEICLLACISFWIWILSHWECYASSFTSAARFFSEG